MAYETFADSPTPGSPQTPWATITAPMDASVSTMQVSDPSPFPDPADYALSIQHWVTIAGLDGNGRPTVNVERVLVTAGLGTGTWTLNRGLHGNTPLTHASGAGVYGVPPSWAILNSPGALTQPGDLPYLAASGDMTRLPAGADGTYLRYVSGLPTAGAIQAGDLPDLSSTYVTPSSLTMTLAGYVPTTRTVNGHALSANVTVSAADVGLGSVENAAASGLYVPLTRTVNGHALSSNVSVTASDVGLGNVENAAASALYQPIFGSQSANRVYAGPTTGSAATPTFRALVAADIPDISATYLTPGAAAAAYQPLDADLTAIAALSGTGGWAKRTGTNTWTISTPTASDVGALSSTLPGATTQLLFNNAGSLGASSNLTWRQVGSGSDHLLVVGTTAPPATEADAGWRMAITTDGWDNGGETLQVVGAGAEDGDNTILGIFGSRGHVATPSALDAGDYWAELGFYGYGDTGYHEAAFIRAQSTGLWTDSLHPMDMELYVNRVVLALNETTSKFYFDRVTITDTGNVTATGAIAGSNLSGTNTGDQDLSSYVTLSGAQSITNKKLGSLTSNGFVKTSGGDGTLSVDTSTYLTSVTAHNLLSTTHGDTLADSVVRGDILYGNSTPKWARLAKPSVLSNLSHDGTDVSWVTATGTGAPARATSPVFVTPTLGVASGTGLTLTEAVGSSALTLTGATQTSSFPVISATQTWNASGTTFTAIDLNVTNSASASASLLLNLRVGGTSKLSVDRSGVMFAPAGIGSASNPVGTTQSNIFSTAGWNTLQGNSGGGLTFGSGHLIWWGSGTINTSLSGDTGLARNAAGVVEVNNGTKGTLSDITVREAFCAASTTTRASVNVPHGSAPTSPVNGDIWTTTAGLFVRINGATVGPLS